MANAHEREALEDLVTSAGWSYFYEAANAFYSAENSLDAIRMDPKASEAIIAARDAVVRILTWPRERLGELRPPEDV